MVKVNRSLSIYADEISNEHGIPLNTTEQVIKSFIEGLKLSALNGEAIVLTGIVTVTVLYDKTDEVYKPYCRVSQAFKDYLVSDNNDTLEVNQRNLPLRTRRVAHQLGINLNTASTIIKSLLTRYRQEAKSGKDIDIPGVIKIAIDSDEKSQEMNSYGRVSKALRMLIEQERNKKSEVVEVAPLRDIKPKDFKLPIYDPTKKDILIIEEDVAIAEEVVEL